MIRGLIKLLWWFAVLWVAAAEWQWARDEAVIVVERVALALDSGSARTDAVALLISLGALFAPLMLCGALVVPLDRRIGPTRHPFPDQQLRIRLRMRRGRFLPSVLLVAFGYLLALRIAPLVVDIVVTPARWPVSGDSGDVALAHGVLHGLLVMITWTVMAVSVRIALGTSPERYGFVGYHQRALPAFALYWRLALLVHLPLAVFSATRLDHPWHFWLTLGSLALISAWVIVGHLLALAMELRRDRWLNGLDGASAWQLRSRTIAFLHPGAPIAAPIAASPVHDDRVADETPSASDTGQEGAEYADGQPDDAGDRVDDGWVEDDFPAADEGHEETWPSTGDDDFQSAGQGPDMVSAGTPAVSLAMAEALAAEGDSRRARVLAREVEASGDPDERARAGALLRALPDGARRLRLAAGAVCVVALCVLGAFGWQVMLLPSGEETEALARSAHVHVRKDADGVRLLGTRYDYSLNTSLANISPHFVNAVVASEDHRFFEHGAAYKLAKFAEAGVLCAARKLNVFSSARACAGNSTIGQQLARNLFLSEKRSITRKLVELIWAIKMEWSLSKETILELYLNRVYLGRGNFGVELASRSYFNKPAARLDLHEAALLAAAVKRPGWNWAEDRDAAMARARLILALMRRHGFADAQDRFPPGFSPSSGVRPPRKPYLGHLWQWIRPQVRRAMSELPAGDYKVLTSLDAEVEIYAERHLEEEVSRLSRAGIPVSQGAVVVMRPDGTVLAMVGGVGDDLTARGLNRAKRTAGLHARPPASAFKPFVYLAALEMGLRPDDLVNAAPVDIAMPAPQPPYRPQNHDGRTYGSVPMRTGLSSSINTAAVNLLHDTVGFDRLFDVVERLGVDTSGFPRQWGLALGAASVPLVEMVGAYGAFATGGIPVEPHAVLAVTTAAGRTVWRRPASDDMRRFDATHISRLNEMLRAVVEGGTARQARHRLPATLEVAGKTGTGDAFTDAWFIGYTSELVVGVWMGNDVPRSMPGLYGGTGPARVFNRITRDLVDYTRAFATEGTLP